MNSSTAGYESSFEFVFCESEIRCGEIWLLPGKLAENCPLKNRENLFLKRLSNDQTNRSEFMK